MSETASKRHVVCPMNEWMNEVRAGHSGLFQTQSLFFFSFIQFAYSNFARDRRCLEFGEENKLISALVGHLTDSNVRPPSCVRLWTEGDNEERKELKLLTWYSREREWSKQSQTTEFEMGLAISDQISIASSNKSRRVGQLRPETTEPRRLTRGAGRARRLSWIFTWMISSSYLKNNLLALAKSNNCMTIMTGNYYIIIFPLLQAFDRSLGRSRFAGLAQSVPELTRRRGEIATHEEWENFFCSSHSVSFFRAMMAFLGEIYRADSSCHIDCFTSRRMDDILAKNIEYFEISSRLRNISDHGGSFSFSSLCRPSFDCMWTFRERENKSLPSLQFFFDLFV